MKKREITNKVTNQLERSFASYHHVRKVEKQQQQKLLLRLQILLANQLSSLDDEKNNDYCFD